MTLDCRDYIDQYLSAHADNELTPSERRSVEDHLAGCAACRSRLADERTLKALVRQHSGIVKSPADVRLRIRAALGAMVEANLAGGRSRDRHERSRPFGEAPAGITRRIVSQARRVRVWGPVVAAATLIGLLVLFNGRTRQVRAEPAFELAIAKCDSFARDFMPNVPAEAYSSESGSDFAWVVNTDPNKRVSDALEDVADSYMRANMPDNLYNFDGSGYVLDGGRVDHLPNGRPVTYTLYRGSGGSSDVILNICFKDPRMMLPVGAINWIETHSFYQYKGYSFCVTFYPTGHFVSIVVAHMPVAKLIRGVALAEAVNTGDIQ
jgi:Putative zinc-finger